jgi:hypothetical protein
LQQPAGRADNPAIPEGQTVRARLLLILIALVLSIGCDSIVEFFIQNESGQSLKTGWFREGDCTLEGEARRRDERQLESVAAGETLRVSGSVPQGTSAACVVVKDAEESRVLVLPFEPSKTYVIDVPAMAASLPALPAVGENDDGGFNLGPTEMGALAVLALTMGAVILTLVRRDRRRQKVGAGL